MRSMGADGPVPTVASWEAFLTCLREVRVAGMPLEEKSPSGGAVLGFSRIPSPTAICGDFGADRRVLRRRWPVTIRWTCSIPDPQRSMEQCGGGIESMEGIAPCLMGSLGSAERLMSSGPSQNRHQNFRDAFCDAVGCAADDYHARAFVHGVSPWRRFYVVPVFWIFPGLFEMDLHIVDYLGDTRTKSEFCGVVDEFHKAVHVSKGLSKRVLGLRMSGATLVALRDRLDPLIAPRS